MHLNVGKTVEMPFDGKNLQEISKLTFLFFIILKRYDTRASSGHALGLLIYHINIQTCLIGIYSRSQVSVYRTIGPLVFKVKERASVTRKISISFIQHRNS